jgi:hypothetical protein
MVDFEDLRATYPKMAGSLITLNNEWMKITEGFLGDKTVAAWMDANFADGAYNRMWKRMAEGLVEEFTDLPDEPFTALYPALLLWGAPRINGKGQLKRNMQALGVASAVVGIVGGKLCWIAENFTLADGSPGPSMTIGGFDGKESILAADAMYLGSMLSKAHGVQFVIRDDDGDEEIQTFIMSGDFISERWKPFQQRLLAPFN